LTDNIYQESFDPKYVSNVIKRDFLLLINVMPCFISNGTVPISVESIHAVSIGEDYISLTWLVAKYVSTVETVDFYELNYRDGSQDSKFTKIVTQQPNVTLYHLLPQTVYIITVGGLSLYNEYSRIFVMKIVIYSML